MMANAREKWLIGATALVLFAVSFLFMLLGTPTHYNYGNTYPWLTMVGVFVLGGTAAFTLWKYLHFVKYGTAKKS